MELMRAPTRSPIPSVCAGPRAKVVPLERPRVHGSMARVVRCAETIRSRGPARNVSDLLEAVGRLDVAQTTPQGRATDPQAARRMRAMPSVLLQYRDDVGIP